MYTCCFNCLFVHLQENDSKRARAIKKAGDEREMKKAKDVEIERCVSESFACSDHSLSQRLVIVVQHSLASGLKMT